MAKITINNAEIVFYKKEQEDYISLTDIASVEELMPIRILRLNLRYS